MTVLVRKSRMVPRPRRSILDPSFRYTSSANTDLRKTFERVRWEQERERREAEERDAVNDEEVQA